MPNNVATTTVAPSALPNATSLATQQLADGSHASVAVITDPTDRTHQLLITAAGEAKVNAADGANVTQGAKADAAWDGAAAAPTIVAIWKYCAAKIEAVRAALVTDGANPTVGAKADAAWDGAAASPTIVAIKKYMSVKLEAIRVALVTDGANATVGAKADAVWDGAAASPTIVALNKYIATKIEAVRAALTDAAAVSLIKKVSDATRVPVVLSVFQYQLASSAETLINVMQSTEGFAAHSGNLTSYSPPAGKTFRITQIIAFLEGQAGITTAVTAKLAIRVNAAGAALIGSPQQGPGVSLAGINSTTAAATASVVPIPDGLEMTSAAGLGLTVACPGYVVTTAAPLLNVTVMGYYFTT